jgi:hypothetical protein
MKLVAYVLLAACAALAADTPGAPRLFFSRTFPGSTPPYIQVTVDKNGDVEYREAVDDELPLKFKLPQANTEEMFGLAEKLDYFKHPLEAPVKVAFMGTKVFRYENGAEKTEVKFNYSQDVSAQALLDWFERLAETAQNRINLERTAKYDHLGVMKALLLVESALDRGRLAAPEQFLPMLDRVANNETYMHTARVRAAEIAEMIRTPKK